MAFVGQRVQHLADPETFFGHTRTATLRAADVVAVNQDGTAELLVYQAGGLPPLKVSAVAVGAVGADGLAVARSALKVDVTPAKK